MGQVMISLNDSIVNDSIVNCRQIDDMNISGGHLPEFHS